MPDIRADGSQGDSSFLAYLEEPIKSIMSYEPKQASSGSQALQGIKQTCTQTQPVNKAIPVLILLCPALPALQCGSLIRPMPLKAFMGSYK